jgi:hypothetical protein
VNQDHGANLKTKRTFDDFKVHYEVNCPNNGNSGFYLRGRYEVQIEYEPLSENPPERRIGSIYGRIAPKLELPRTPGPFYIQGDHTGGLRFRNITVSVPRR